MDKDWVLDWPVKWLILVGLGVPILVALSTFAGIRYFYRSSGKWQVYKDGIVLTDEGIEFMGFCFTGTRKRNFSEIDSVELISYFKWSIGVFRYGLNVNTVTPIIGGKVLVIKLKRANPDQYLFFAAPRGAEELVEQLNGRIKS